MSLITRDALQDFVPFVQFKKCEMHSWRSDTEACNFTKSTTFSWVFKQQIRELSSRQIEEECDRFRRSAFLKFKPLYPP